MNEIHFSLLDFFLLTSKMIELTHTFLLISGTIRTMAVLDLESKPHYWLTVCAQDQAVVPLHSCVQVSISTNLLSYNLFYIFFARVQHLKEQKTRQQLKMSKFLHTNDFLACVFLSLLII